ncbi:hypothetical protein DC31_03455 [Microbacterium sp. CH12i]|uniref:hypothetical protein n=1 Tax=Microbacterium sp. CH12i TaxID=1479651 RepID=UPI0004616E15|nr:hypothetical protein [Microbacterium sp. CH12i]KDA05246.1 hypothetical protein DC31_03455 [Microbacterium sp. CH12i]
MSDDVNITHGGAISVDPDALRAVANGMNLVAVKFTDAVSAIGNAYRIIVDEPGFSDRIDTVALWASSQRTGQLHDECQLAAENTLLMADVFELVELKAQLAALAVQDAAGADALTARIAELEASDERLSIMADYLVGGWEQGRFKGLDEQFDLAGVLGPWGLAPIIAAAATLGVVGGLGVVRQGTKLGGTADPVAVTPLKTSNPITPPASLADAFRRFPSSDGAQLKVERYTMADGTNRFALYMKGTQSGYYGSGNPLDMKSNLELYTNQQSASYQATIEALEAAGAQPGDQVDVYAHSQSGMIAAHLSMESEFDVKVQVTAGSPVTPTLDGDQLLIQLGHTDDAVRSLAGGGSPGGTGSPDSFVATREGSPGKQLEDVTLDAHMLDTYIETAEMVDASGDVRLHAIEENWRELADAVEIESTEYRVDRTGWSTE